MRKVRRMVRSRKQQKRGKNLNKENKECEAGESQRRTVQRKQGRTRLQRTLLKRRKNMTSDNASKKDEE